MAGDNVATEQNDYIVNKKLLARRSLTEPMNDDKSDDGRIGGWGGWVDGLMGKDGDGGMGTEAHNARIEFNSSRFRIRPQNRHAGTNKNGRRVRTQQFKSKRGSIEDVKQHAFKCECALLSLGDGLCRIRSCHSQTRSHKRDHIWHISKFNNDDDYVERSDILSFALPPRIKIYQRRERK